MPSEYIHTTVEGKKLKLSNPNKILYPDSGISKAEIIKYLLEVNLYMLPLISHRPMTLIRYPDGIIGKRFYSKNKPSWTPEWIYSTLFPGDNDNHYISIDNLASLVWMGNLAALEMHPMNVRYPNLLYPDQFIFDLDPSTEVDFERLKELAKNLRQFLEDKGFVPFIKTSGSKGLHIYVPIKPTHTIAEVYRYVKKIGQEYVTNHDKNTTLKISKAQRKGKVLLDIYRNAKAQSCVAPFSLRAKPHAPISTPFDWEQLDGLPDSQFWTINNIFEHLEKNGNAWEDFSKHSVALPTKIQKVTKSLEPYIQKRDFNKTSEPKINEDIHTSGHDYVVQMHNASNLHYDLRLEENGALLSWAIPKGFPHKSGIKRLAIRTEDHPLKYLHFEGVIPKNEYGGGEMWIFDSGIYEVLKKSEKKYQFILKNGQLQGEYLLYNTKENRWILEKKGTDFQELAALMEPMLAELGKNIPSKKDYFYEIKWDGIRAIIIIENGEVKIYSRNGNDITNQFPKLSNLTEVIEAETAVLDGEIVHLDEEGKPLFHKIVGRIHTKGDHSIQKAAANTPAVLYLFDLIYLDGKDCRSESNIRRREWLSTIISPNETIRFSEAFDDGKMLLSAIKEQGMEGIMCKHKTGKYYSGERHRVWKKIKVSEDAVSYIIGYTTGEGDRSELIGALHLAVKEENKLVYMGKVGTGFTLTKLRDIYEKLSEVPTIKKPVINKIEEPKKTIWKEPVYLCKIKYASLSSNETYREPVFIKMWKEK